MPTSSTATASAASKELIAPSGYVIAPRAQHTQEVIHLARCAITHRAFLRDRATLFCARAPRRARDRAAHIFTPAPSCTLHKTTYCRYAMLLHSIVIVNFTANYLEHRHSAVAMILSNSERVQQYSGRRRHSERLVRCLHSPAKLLNMRPQPTQGLHLHFGSAELQTSWTRM